MSIFQSLLQRFSQKRLFKIKNDLRFLRLSSQISLIIDLLITAVIQRSQSECSSFSEFSLFLLSPNNRYLKKRLMNAQDSQGSVVQDLPRIQPYDENPAQITLLGMFRFANSRGKVMMGLASFFAFGAGGLIPIYSSEIGKANQFITELTNTSDIEAIINQTGLNFLYFGTAILVAMAVALVLFFLAGEQQETAIRQAYLLALMRQDAEWYDSVDQGELASTFSEDVQHIRQAISNHLAILLQIVGCCVVSLVIIFVTGWLLSLVCLVVLPFIVIVSYLYLRSYEGRNDEYKRIYSKAGTLSQQAIYAVKTVKMLNGEPIEEAKYSQELGQLRQHYYRLSSKVGTTVALMNICFFLLNALAYWYGSQCVVSGTICPESVSKQTYEPMTVSIIFYVLLNCYYLVVLISPTANGLSQGKNAANKVFAVIDRQPTIRSPPNAIRPESFEGNIDFVRVSFAYPKNKSKKVLDSVSMRLSMRNVALMGESGCGKSTILQLILRLYDPDQGQILLDGHDLRDLDLEWLRSQIGYVGQEPVLFAGSIRDNFRLYAPEVPDKDIEAALKNAEIYDFVIRQLPQGLDTYVGVGGRMISGGQKQRIAIARALLKKPKLMIFDEATSALDKLNEKKVLRNLQLLPHKPKTIAVSHRVQVSQIADYVYVFDEGNIIQEGKFSNLQLYQCFMGIPTTKELQDIYLRKKKSFGNLRQTIKLIKKQTKDLQVSCLKIEGNISQQVLSPRKKKNSKVEIVGISSMDLGDQQGDNIRKTQIQCLIDAIAEAPRLKNKQSLRISAIQRALFNYMEKLMNRSEQQNIKKPTTMGMMCRIFSYNEDRKGVFVAAVALSFFLGLTIPVMSYLAAQLYFALALINNYSLIGIEPLAQSQTDEGFSKRQTTLIIFLAFAGVYFVVYLFQVITSYTVGSEVTRTLREKLYAKFLRMPVSWFERTENNPGVLSAALGQDCETVNELASMLLFIVIIIVTGISSCYIVGFIFNWKITLLGFGFLPFILFCALYKSHLQAELNKVKDEIRRDSNIIVAETLVDIKTVAALNIAKQLHARYCQLEDRPQDEATRVGIKMGLVTAFGHFLNYAALGALFFFTGKLFTASNYTLNLQYALIALFEAFNVTFAISSNYHFIPNVSEAMEIAERLLSYFDEQDEEILQREQKSKMLTEGITEGKVRFDKVSFGYQSREGRIFDSLSFVLRPQSTLAIIGKSGCGKSTILNLLLRFYETSGGTITIDGIDIRDFDMRYLRSKIGVISQQPYLINGSIRSNILYGRPDASEEEMKEAAEKANATKFIMKDEGEEVDSEGGEQAEPAAAETAEPFREATKQRCKGFDKLVGFNGSNLSGGQKQRIAIARIVVRNPTILMYDEATSALDVENEKKMQRLLEELSRGKTTLNISHKLESVKNSDLIIMVDGGRIVEQGTYAELLNKKGYFFNLQRGEDAELRKTEL